MLVSALGAPTLNLSRAEAKPIPRFIVIPIIGLGCVYLLKV